MLAFTSRRIGVRGLQKRITCLSGKPRLEFLESRTLLDGSNLIVNGDFEAGNSGFSSQYTYSAGNILPDSTYDIVDNPTHSRPNDNEATSYGDHTSGTGLMMAVNGSQNPNMVVWSQTLAVAPANDYQFSLWSSTWFASAPASFDIQFNGASIGTPQAPSGAGVWQQFTANWNSGSSTSLTITIVDNTTDISGNDFALDDISLTGPGGTSNAGVLQMSTVSLSAKENVGTIELTVLRTQGSTGTVSVDFATANGSAAAGTRYTAASGTVTFGNGETFKTVTLTVLDDALLEASSQTFTVSLSNPTGGATLAPPTSTTISLIDTDLPVVPDAVLPLPKLQAAGSDVAQSEEHFRQFVQSAYSQFLNRSPDNGGLSFWVSQMQAYETSGHTQGLRQEDIEAGFLDSPEYLGRYGGVGANWISGIYHDLLGRTADTSGLDYWLGQLNSGILPTEVALGFTASVERLKARITDTYMALLGRTPDVQGLSFWVGVFQAGGTTEDIISGFVGSLEYYNRAGGAAGNAAKWVRQVYLDVLGRPATVNECDSWLTFFNLPT